MLLFCVLNRLKSNFSNTNRSNVHSTYFNNNNKCCDKQITIRYFWYYTRKYGKMEKDEADKKKITRKVLSWCVLKIHKKKKRESNKQNWIYAKHVTSFSHFLFCGSLFNVL